MYKYVCQLIWCRLSLSDNIKKLFVIASMPSLPAPSVPFSVPTTVQLWMNTRTERINWIWPIVQPNEEETGNAYLLLMSSHAHNIKGSAEVQALHVLVAWEVKRIRELTSRAAFYLMPQSLLKHGDLIVDESLL